VMLSVLILHGIVPGPNVMTEHGGMVYGFLITLFIAGALILPFGFLFCRLFSKITVVKSSVLVPLLFVMCIIGSFAERQYMIDMSLMMIFGLLGIILESKGYPLIPFLFGIVLGPISESSFVLAIRISRYSLGIFFDSVLCKAMWVIIALVIICPMVIKARKKRKAKADVS